MGNKMRKFLFGVLAMMVVALPVVADEAEDKVREAVLRLAPNLTVDSIKPSPVPGLYEVAFGTEIIYVSQDGKYLIQGSVIETATRSNLTEQAKGAGRAKILETLSEDDMVVFAPKEVKHTVTVFTDIDCGYCRKLHGEMEKYNALGIKIRYAAYPRAGLDSASFDKAESVWCAEDRQAAMTTAKAGQMVPAKRCDSPVKNQYLAGRALGLSGTPALFLENGQLVPGYVPADELLKMLEEH
jgi:thiol:disulfide interchange protein DsbC